MGGIGSGTGKRGMTWGELVQTETGAKDLRRGPSGALAVACVTLLTVTALAMSDEAAAQAAETSNRETRIGNDIPEVPGDDIFGFTSTTDTGKKGDRGIANEITGFHGRRDGRYNVLSNKTEYSYSPADDWWVAASGFISNHRIRGVTGVADNSITHFDGFSAEVQYRFIKRSRSNPFALAVAVEPAYAFSDLTTGQKSEGYGAAFKLLVDAVIVPDKLFWAANAIWLPVRSQDIEDRSIWLTTSASQLSAALTWQLSPSVFVGVEVRQMTIYGGTFFKERIGYANYLGPTLLWKLTDKIAFNTTWQPQISGRSSDNPTLRHDLDNFERAQFRFKLAMELD
ncbi:hypothetical protein [Pseudorhodoplanes sp.]|uniref:hypothetical protein n=1 Tax=Pseudorhodoplanes sp. TaxID=1934341 RepID=UPI00391D3BBE